MSKLQHSLSGFRWYMQMSANRLFVLVEGKDTDPFFYSSIVRPVCQSASIPCDIVRSDFVAGAGGKKTLLALHEYLSSVKALRHVTRTGSKACIIYLDKDADDVVRATIKSAHVVYTPSYCVENELFIHANLVLAAAAASSLDTDSLTKRIPDQAQWRRQKADHWQRFLILCLLSHKLALNCDCHYGRLASPLNNPADAATDLGQAAAIEAELETRSGLPARKFTFKLAALTRYVARKYRNGQHDSLFNGKWYLEFLRREINVAAAGRSYNAPSNSTLIASLVLTVDFGAPWTDHFKEPLLELIHDMEPQRAD